jgi:hypothetical protein
MTSTPAEPSHKCRSRRVDHSQSGSAVQPQIAGNDAGPCITMKSTRGLPLAAPGADVMAGVASRLARRRDLSLPVGAGRHRRWLRLARPEQRGRSRDQGRRMRGSRADDHLRLAIGRHREARLSGQGSRPQQHLQTNPSLLGAQMGGPASRQSRGTPVSPNHRAPARPLHSAVMHEEAHRGAHHNAHRADTGGRAALTRAPRGHSVAISSLPKPKACGGRTGEAVCGVQHRHSSEFGQGAPTSLLHDL